MELVQHDCCLLLREANWPTFHRLPHRPLEFRHIGVEQRRPLDPFVALAESDIEPDSGLDQPDVAEALREITQGRTG